LCGRHLRHVCLWAIKSAITTFVAGDLNSIILTDKR